MRTTERRREEMQQVIDHLRLLPAACADMDFAQLYERDVEALLHDLEEVTNEIEGVAHDLAGEDLSRDELRNELLGLLNLLR